MFSIIRSSLIRPGKQLKPVSYIACNLHQTVIKQYSTSKRGNMPKVAVDYIYQYEGVRKMYNLMGIKARISSCLHIFHLYKQSLRKVPVCQSYLAKFHPVLSGCGVYDGSEVHESSAVLVHLSRAGADISMFAPDIEQMHTINHTKGEPMEPNRNVLVESARIARGKVSALSTLTANDFDAVVFPGGFGAAKNLSTFAVDGVNMKVNEDVERVIKDFHANKKPIGLCCISPVLAANVLKGCKVTVGSDKEGDGRWPYAGTAGAIQSMGSTHVCKDVSEAHSDVKNKIVTTPAFMCETKFHEIFDGIGKMIEGVMKIL